MGAEIDHGARETVILHPWHGDEELVVQKPPDGVLLLPQKVHKVRVSSFLCALKTAFLSEAHKNHVKMMLDCLLAWLQAVKIEFKHQRMKIPFCLFTVIMLGACTSAYASASDWFDMEGARIRIVTTGDADADGRLKGVLDINLKPGWKTYWRDPGDAGVPPTLDVSSNPGVEAAQFDFPAPQRHDEGDFQWAGYDYPVRIPVTFTLREPISPGPIEADIFLGVCETICVPVQAKLTVDPAGDPANLADALAVKNAVATIPMAATADFGIRLAEESEGKIVFEASFPGDPSSAELFIAGEGGYFFGTPVREQRAGKTFFSVEVTRPDAKLSGPGLHYTLVTGSGAASGVVPYF